MLLRSVFGKGVRDQRWALLGWGIGVALLVLTEAAVWPSIRDMPHFDELMKNYPEAMRKLFNVEAMTTGTGFMNAELFTLILPMVFIFYGVSRGARMVAGEEESGYLEAVLVTPVSTRSVVLEKAAALATGVVALGLVLALVLISCSAAFGLGIGFGETVVGCLVLVLLGLEFGWLALAVGAATGRRAVALGIGGAAAVAAYVLYALGQIVSSVEAYQPLSPFQQALHNGPLGGSAPLTLLWVALGAVAVIAVAVPVFDRRDLRLH
jgi:beta-exotoxin I transport system permease protein